MEKTNCGFYDCVSTHAWWDDSFSWCISWISLDWGIVTWLAIQSNWRINHRTKHTEASVQNSRFCRHCKKEMVLNWPTGGNKGYTLSQPLCEIVMQISCSWLLTLFLYFVTEHRRFYLLILCTLPTIKLTLSFIYWLNGILIMVVCIICIFMVHCTIVYCEWWYR